MMCEPGHLNSWQVELRGKLSPEWMKIISEMSSCRRKFGRSYGLIKDTTLNKESWVDLLSVLSRDTIIEQEGQLRIQAVFLALPGVLQTRLLFTLFHYRAQISFNCLDHFVTKIKASVRSPNSWRDVWLGILQRSVHYNSVNHSSELDSRHSEASVHETSVCETSVHETSVCEASVHETSVCEASGSEAFYQFASEADQNVNSLLQATLNKLQQNKSNNENVPGSTKCMTIEGTHSLICAEISQMRKPVKERENQEVTIPDCIQTKIGTSGEEDYHNKTVDVIIIESDEEETLCSSQDKDDDFVNTLKCNSNRSLNEYQGGTSSSRKRPLIDVNSETDHTRGTGKCQKLEHMDSEMYKSNTHLTKIDTCQFSKNNADVHSAVYSQMTKLPILMSKSERVKEPDAHSFDQEDLPADIKVELESYKESLHSTVCTLDRLSQLWQCLSAMTLQQIQNACEYVGLGDVSEDMLVLLCHNMTSEFLTHQAVSTVVSCCLKVKLTKLSSHASQSLEAAVTSIVKQLPRTAIDLFMDIFLETNAGDSQCQLFACICKKSLTKEYFPLVIRKLSGTGLRLNNHLIQLLHAGVNMQCDLDIVSTVSFIHLLTQASHECKNNTKFGQLLLGFLTKYGDKISRSDLSLLFLAVEEHQSTFRKSLTRAKGKLKNRHG